MLQRTPIGLDERIGKGDLNLARMRSKHAVSRMESTAPFTFSTPESAYSNGRPAITRCLPAASKTWHVFDGAKRSVTVHARIFRE